MRPPRGSFSKKYNRSFSPHCPRVSCADAPRVTCRPYHPVLKGGKAHYDPFIDGCEEPVRGSPHAYTVIVPNFAELKRRGIKFTKDQMGT